MERLQKYMARCGVASRRASEAMILDGLVTVNGQVVKELGYKIDPNSDIILVNGSPINIEQKVYYLLHKPIGYVTTVKDPQNRLTVLDLIDGEDKRIYPVGRLDYDTSGLLLLTNDGELANKMTHPSYELSKTYIAKITGLISNESIAKLQKGIMLEDGMTAPAEAEILKATNSFSVVKLVIHEGRNRQVRRMIEAVGHRVLKLKRESIGPLTIDGLDVGEYRDLTTNEYEQLMGKNNM